MLLRVFLAFAKQLVSIFKKLSYAIYIARMKGKGYHAFDGRKVYFNRAVINRSFTRGELFVIVCPLVDFKVAARGVIRSPNRRKAGRFGSHHVYAVSVFHRKRCYAVAYEFEHLVFHKPALKNGSYQRKRDILRADAGLWFSCQPYCDHIRVSNIICTSEKLFYKLRPAFSYSHASYCAVSCVAVRAEYHFAAAGKIFPHI